MTYLSSAMFVIGPLSVGIMLLLLMVLSRRLGHALEIAPYYRLYMVSVAFLFLAILIVSILQLAGASEPSQSQPQATLIIKVFATLMPMAVSVTLALVATVKYWHWVWGELLASREKGGERGEGSG